MDRTQRDGVCLRGIKYSPLPSQARFHRSRARFKGFSGPIGSGKSQALCHEAIKLSYLNGGRVGLIGAPTYPMLRDATLASLFDILNTNFIPYEYSEGDNVLTMVDTQSRVLCRSIDEFERLRGTNLAWFALDELTYSPEAAWLVLEGRLRDPKATRLCGFAVWTPKGYDWVYRKFISDPRPGYNTTLARPFENHYLLEQIPDFYDLLKSSYDDSFFQQEVLGKYLNVQAGLVYYAFNRQEHVTSLQVRTEVPLLWALDFNVDPMCSVVAQVIHGTLFVLDEIILRHASTLQACEEFTRRFPSHPAGITVYGDASGNNLHTTGTSDYQIVREYFATTYSGPLHYKVPKANPSVRDRITLTNARLKTASGDVQLYVDTKCIELIKDFEQVSYKADSNIPDKDKDRRRTHVSDALGYPSGNAVMLNTPALQTNFSPASTAFWKQAYLDLATLMSDAGQIPYLQFGEVQWWYRPDDGSGMPYYDAYATSTFQATYGRPMRVFTNSNVSPAAYLQEAQFLPGLIGAFTSAIMSFVRATFPNAKFEVLYPPDANNTPLNGAVNLPASWNPATLNGLKTENFNFTSGRNLDLARNSILLPMQMGFAQAASSHLVGITGYTTSWEKEVRMSLGENLESVVLFALDQFCLMSCPVPLPIGARSGKHMGAVR